MTLRYIWRWRASGKRFCNKYFAFSSKWKAGLRERYRCAWSCHVWRSFRDQVARCRLLTSYIILRRQICIEDYYWACRPKRLTPEYGYREVWTTRFRSKISVRSRRASFCTWPPSRHNTPTGSTSTCRCNNCVNIPLVVTTVWYGRLQLNRERTKDCKTPGLIGDFMAQRPSE